jgi:hypothetical protein
VQRFKLSFGVATAFFPEATEDRCFDALLLEVDPVASGTCLSMSSARLRLRCRDEGQRSAARDPVDSSDLPVVWHATRGRVGKAGSDFDGLPASPILPG